MGRLKNSTPRMPGERFRKIMENNDLSLGLMAYLAGVSETTASTILYQGTPNASIKRGLESFELLSSEVKIKRLATLVEERNQEELKRINKYLIKKEIHGKQS